MDGTKSASLIALSTTALALPGIGRADSPPVQSTLSYKFSNYQEDELSRSEVLFGDLDRYDIDVHQFQLLTPVGRDMSLQLDASHDTLSGASPWFTTADLNGNPIVSLSGASGITDQRTAVSVGARYYLENGSVGASIGHSEENDYRSLYFGINGEHHFNNDLTTVSLGLSYSTDEIFPTDAELFNRVTRENKHSVSTALSITQIINQTSSIQTALSFTEVSGFLSDPYKLRDVRPDGKFQFAWSNSYRKFIVSADAALHANYRFYHDDYGISSHTFDMAWHQNINSTFKLVPALRYYSQSAADFFTNIDDFSKPTSQYQSSDYRLAAFGAISGTLSLIANLGDWTATLNAERYVANEKYSAFTVNQPSTALVRYFRVSLGLDYRF